MNHLGTVTLETERLCLRPFRESDAEGVFRSFVNDADFLYYANKAPRTLAQEAQSLRGIEEKYADRRYYNWLITLKDATVIGAVHLNVEDYNESLEFNYAVDARHRGRGYMTEALRAVREFAVDALHANRFFGGCEVGNLASARVMEKCGLRFEGVLRSHLKLRDGYHDMRVYSFIRGVDEQTVIDAIAEMRRALKRTPYACAFGYAMHTPDDVLHDVIVTSDERMYANKAEMKQQTLAQGGTLHSRE